MSDRMTPERVDAVIEEVATVDHEATVTIVSAPEDLMTIAHGVTHAIAERYQYVLVPRSFTIHSDGSNVVHWSWQTKSPSAAVGKEGES